MKGKIKGWIRKHNKPKKKPISEKWLSFLEAVSLIRYLFLLKAVILFIVLCLIEYYYENYTEIVKPVLEETMTHYILTLMGGFGLIAFNLCLYLMIKNIKLEVKLERLEKEVVKNG